jgi:hypothetical protein
VSDPLDNFQWKKGVTLMASTSNRSESMKAAWDARRSQAAKIAAWTEKPTCLCGCGAELKKAKSPAAQSNFKAGHDAVLKATALKRPNEVPEIARIMRHRLGFLKTRPELMKAFTATSVRRQRRAPSAH